MFCDYFYFEAKDLNVPRSVKLWYLITFSFKRILRKPLILGFCKSTQYFSSFAKNINLRIMYSIRFFGGFIIAWGH